MSADPRVLVLHDFLKYVATQHAYNGADDQGQRFYDECLNPWLYGVAAQYLATELPGEDPDRIAKEYVRIMRRMNPSPRVSAALDDIEAGFGNESRRGGMIDPYKGDYR